MDGDDVFDRDGYERLEVLTRNGVCKMYPSHVRHNVTIWIVAGSLEQVQAWLQRA